MRFRGLCILLTLIGLCHSCNRQSNRSSGENMNEEPHSPSSTGLSQELSTLEQAQAMASKHVFLNVNSHLHHLGISALIPKLNLDEVLELKETLLAQAVIDETNLALVFRRVAQLDKIRALAELEKLEGFNVEQIGVIRSLIELTSVEMGVSREGGYFSEDNMETGFGGSFGLFDGDELWFYYHYLNAQINPDAYRKKILEEEDGMDLYLEIYAAVMVKRGELKKLSSLRESDIVDIDFLDELIYQNVVFADVPASSEWFEQNKKRLYNEYREDSYKIGQVDRKIKFAQEYAKEHKTWLNGFEKDLLLLPEMFWSHSMLQFDQLEQLGDGAMEKLLEFLILLRGKPGYANYGGLEEVCAYIYSARYPLKTYRLIRDPDYSRYRLNLCLPLLPLLKKHQSLAIREYEKLCKWPLVVPIGLFPPTADDLSFDFLYQLSKQDLKTALNLGGKTLIYPSPGWGSVEPEGFAGVVAALVEDGKMGVLLERIVPLPDEIRIEKYHDVIDAIAFIDPRKARELAKKFHAEFPQEGFLEDILWTAFHGADPNVILTMIDKGEFPLDEGEEMKAQKENYLREYFETLSHLNPHLAFQLARKHDMLNVVKKTLSD